ncbi:hypothetical protein, unlikely [Trypanosoma brucei gambiense DAL972]|uniref:Uncharacterized protein n=1 Tax=Trypanosoma brucei gambiense (strain MHOM/CI/86/DAL972) TaxID=679716 RepID=C9ZNH8_TRYB9|nr:hypothetical protein, unlikely [Trypanosoma brucei gambiense DAL972]CBH10956.1 hypothetical protein, unlikely [Trypanosoma brucei gambiense DAL972]|eukprot:XP_011773243.1 hypothetical protein, unlikely [Trypanosoma brucei gambiense DAL972]
MPTRAILRHAYSILTTDTPKLCCFDHRVTQPIRCRGVFLIYSKPLLALPMGSLAKKLCLIPVVLFFVCPREFILSMNSIYPKLLCDIPHLNDIVPNRVLSILALGFQPYGNYPIHLVRWDALCGDSVP